MTKDDERILCERLRLKWIPFAQGFDSSSADEYERFLSLHVDEQTELVRKMNTEDGELYILLSESRIQYGKT